MESQIEMIFSLLVIFHIKHYVADFPLQREYMLRKSMPGWEFVAPLSVHCGIHALLTAGIVLVYAPQFWWLAIADFVIHFITDRLKSGPRFFGRFNDLTRPSYWNIFGFDQMVHHLTHVGFIYVLVATQP